MSFSKQEASGPTAGIVREIHLSLPLCKKEQLPRASLHSLFLAIYFLSLRAAQVSIYKDRCEWAIKSSEVGGKGTTDRSRHAQTMKQSSTNWGVTEAKTLQRAKFACHRDQAEKPWPRSLKKGLHEMNC